MLFKRRWLAVLLAAFTVMAQAPHLFGQADQGTITGVIQDQSGAVIANADITLTNIDLGQTLKAKSDGAGVYVFSPIKMTPGHQAPQQPAVWLYT